MLTGLELTLMGVTWSNSGLVNTPVFIVSPVGKRKRAGGGAKKSGEGGKKGIEKERKEVRRNKERSEAR